MPWIEVGMMARLCKQRVGPMGRVVATIARNGSNAGVTSSRSKVAAPGHLYFADAIDLCRIEPC